jgi:hypothetical protein
LALAAIFLAAEVATPELPDQAAPAIRNTTTQTAAFSAVLAFHERRNSRIIVSPYEMTRQIFFAISLLAGKLNSTLGTLFRSFNASSKSVKKLQPMQVARCWRGIRCGRKPRPAEYVAQFCVGKTDARMAEPVEWRGPKHQAL